jgi:hypothetical protein
MITTASLPGSVLLGRVYTELSVHDMDGPDPESLGARRGCRAARTDVESPLMERAFDLGSHDEAFGQRPGTVGTLILRGIELPIEFEHRVRQVIQHDSDRRIGLDIGSGT